MRRTGLFHKRLSIDVIILIMVAAVGAVVLTSCWFLGYDSFANTEPAFQTDKDDYSVGDTITLKLVLHGESTVRFYENIEHTLKIWLAFRVPYREGHTTATQHGIRSEIVESRDRGNINTYEIRKGVPLQLSFRGYLHETAEEDAFLIVFPSLNRKYIVKKTEYANALALEIHGHLKPIRCNPLDSMEDYVKPVQLVISYGHGDEASTGNVPLIEAQNLPSRQGAPTPFEV